MNSVNKAGDGYLHLSKAGMFQKQIYIAKIM